MPLYKLFDAIFFIKTLSIRKISNSLILKTGYFLSTIFKQPIFLGKPQSLSIEPTNLCNLQCPECPSGKNKLNRPRLFLPINQYKKIIDEVKNHLVFLQLYFQGEPFMHPQIIEFIRYANSKKIYTSTSTNGQFITQNMADKIVQSGLNRLIISIDGTTQEIYEKYRVGGSLDLAIKAIKNMVEAKTKQNKKTPYLMVQFVVFSTNEHQINDIRRLVKEFKNVELKLKSAQIEEYKYGSSLFPKNNKYNRYTKNENGEYELIRNKRFKCWRIYSSPVISANNELLPCCFDKTGKYTYSELNDTSISKSWNSKKAKSFKGLVWRKHSNIDMCTNCSEGIKQTWFS